MRIETGLRYAKAQGIQLDFKRGRNRDSVGLGSYLVNSSAAATTVTPHPSITVDPFGGAWRAEARSMSPAILLVARSSGPFVSRDITPFEDGKPAGLTSVSSARHAHRGGPGQPGSGAPGDAMAGLSDDNRSGPPSRL